MHQLLRSRKQQRGGRESPSAWQADEEPPSAKLQCPAKAGQSTGKRWAMPPLAQTKRQIPNIMLTLSRRLQTSLPLSFKRQTT